MTGKDFSSKLNNRPKVVTVEVPALIGTDKAWREVNRLKSEDHTIKSMIEREWTHTSLVIMELE